MIAGNIAQREAMGICPIEAEALASHMVDDGDEAGNDASTPTEWMLWYADTRKEARSHDALLEQHKVSPFLSDEEVKEMMEVAQLRRKIEHSMVADELMAATEWIERRNNNNDQEDESVGYSEDETVSDSEDKSEGESDADDNGSDFVVLPAAPPMD